LRFRRRMAEECIEVLESREFCTCRACNVERIW
jgi:hypothetical protein